MVDEHAESEGLDDFLRSLGATDGQIAEARREQHLAGLASDLVLARGADLTADDLARRAGVGVEEVRTLWHMLGVSVPDPHRPMFTEADATFISFIVHFTSVGPHGDELLRVVAGSMARVAEAAVSLYVQTVEPLVDVPGIDLVVWAQELAEATEGAVRLGDSMGAIFVHHMREAIERQRVAQADVSERSLHRLAVGFIDLVGFTPLSLHTSPSKLLELISLFEAKAFEVASDHNGRIVKHIGDEVMFVALDAAAGCAIARDITSAYAEGIEPRGGVAFGDVITRHGDYYGTVVNLSSRLAELAVPKEVLVDAATASSARGPFVFRPAGRRLLKGFDDPVEAFSLDIDAVPGAEPSRSAGT
jgi:adenylate cyclase